MARGYSGNGRVAGTAQPRALRGSSFVLRLRLMRLEEVVADLKPRRPAGTARLRALSTVAAPAQKLAAAARKPAMRRWKATRSSRLRLGPTLPTPHRVPGATKRHFALTSWRLEPLRGRGPHRHARPGGNRRRRGFAPPFIWAMAMGDGGGKGESHAQRARQDRRGRAQRTISKAARLPGDPQSALDTNVRYTIPPARVASCRMESRSTARSGPRPSQGRR